MRRAIWLLALAACGESSNPVPPPKPADPLPMQELGSFEYKEKMKLPESVTAWNGRRVRATGYINPPMGSPRELSRFLLVKDLGSCCFGKSPQLNHYVEVRLKSGQTVHFSRDPLTVEGVIEVEERFDGDWPLGLFWMKNAEVVR